MRYFKELFFIPIILVGCGSSQEPATNVDLKMSLGHFNAIAPTSIRTGGFQLAEDPSLQVCDSGICVSVANLVRDRIFEDSSSSVRALLSEFDKKISKINKLSENSMVPCFEDFSQKFQLELPGKVDLLQYLNCYKEFGKESKFAPFSKFFIGISPNFVRQYVRAYFTKGIVSKLMLADFERGENSDSEIWIIQDNSEFGNFSLLWHVLEDVRGGAIEVTGAASNESVTNYGCGMHVRYNSNFIYVQGKFQDENATQTKCDQAVLKSFCFDGNSLKNTSLDVCQVAGLSQLNLASLEAKDVQVEKIRSMVHEIPEKIPDFETLPINTENSKHSTLDE